MRVCVGRAAGFELETKRSHETRRSVPAFVDDEFNKAFVLLMRGRAAGFELETKRSHETRARADQLREANPRAAAAPPPPGFRPCGCQWPTFFSFMDRRVQRVPTGMAPE